jgi:hypothetical protein
MDKVENALNWLSDQEWSWWPALALRPPQNREITVKTLLKLTSIFAPAIALTVAWISTTFLHPPTLYTFGLELVGSSACFFLVFRLTFVQSWNRRARRLREPSVPAAPSAAASPVSAGAKLAFR